MSFKNFDFKNFSLLKNIKKIFVILLSSLLFCTFVITIARKRTLDTILKHLLEYGDLSFILKIVFVTLFFFAVQLAALWFVQVNKKLNDFFSKRTTNFLLPIISIICFTISLFGIFFTEWCSLNYPITEPETVFFTLCSPLKNAKEVFFINLSKFVIIPIVIIIFSIIIFLIVKKSFSRFSCSVMILLLPISLTIFWCAFDVSTLLSLLKEYKKPAEFSEFWEENYIDPKSVEFIFPQKKRNLVFIILESMETSYSDRSNGGLLEKNLIPNLTKIASENISFSQGENLLGGGLDLKKTNWTIAAFTSKFGGIPHNLSASKNPSKLPYFLPNAVFLTDILSENGYKMLFICGSDKEFASRDKFFEEHGNVEIHDLDWYKDNGYLAKFYHNGFWGFEDLYLYEFAKQELSELSKNEEPFFFSLLTVDTHASEGFICADCDTSEKSDFKIGTVIKCADKKISDFLDWCKEQSWYENTTFVIVGDHILMGNRVFDEILNNYNDRRWVDIFINSYIQPVEGATCNRAFSSFDIFPTTLASIGVTISSDKNGVALGRNLFSGNPTIVEQYGLEYINDELAKKIKQFEELTVK